MNLKDLRRRGGCRRRIWCLWILVNSAGAGHFDSPSIVFFLEVQISRRRSERRDLLGSRVLQSRRGFELRARRTGAGDSQKADADRGQTRHPATGGITALLERRVLHGLCQSKRGAKLRSGIDARHPGTKTGPVFAGVGRAVVGRNAQLLRVELGSTQGSRPSKSSPRDLSRSGPAHAYCSGRSRSAKELLMSASIYSSEHEKLGPVSIGPLLQERGPRREDRSLLNRQLRIVQQMIEDMDSQTAAGQRYTMEKVLAFLRPQVGPGALSLTTRNRWELSRLVDQLEREVRRPCPDAHLFGDHAEALVALLLAVV